LPHAVRLPMLIAWAMLLAAGAPARGQFFPPRSQQTAHPAVVRVIAAEQGGASLGSGTLVDVNENHGLVITNWHVVRDAPANVIVVFPDGFQSLGRVLRMDSNWDLAAILINKPNAAPVRVARDAPRIGEPLTIAGYGSGSYRSVSGECTQYLAPSLEHPYELVELAASARQGDSGGPILNSRGELAGVLFGEGGGRTTGAYCGRVHSFLTLAVEQLHKQGNGALASAANEKSDAIEHWRAREGRTDRDMLAGEVVRENLNRATGSTLPASLHTGGQAATAGNNGQPSTALAPVAAIAPPARSDFAGPSQPSITGSDVHARDKHLHAQAPAGSQPTNNFPRAPVESKASDADWSPALENRSLVQQFFAGETLLAQLKTVLACVGALAFAFHGGRMLVRTTISSAKPAGKRRRQ
jgi:S1-C subfamily serine protease